MAEVSNLSSKASKVPWARIGAEFLAIFAGITLSLAADDWRQGRIERHMEREILQEMSADLQLDSAHLESVRERLAEFDRTAVWLLKNLGQEDLPPDTVIARFRGLFGYMTYQPVTSSYVALKDGGQMALISDHEVRRLIVDYYEVGQPGMLAQDDRVWAVYSDLRLVFHRHFGWELPESTDSFPSDPSFGFLTSWDALRSDRETVSVLGRMATDAAAWAGVIVELKQQNARLRETIASQLGDS
jgi:hypothetical protein